MYRATPVYAALLFAGMLLGQQSPAPPAAASVKWPQAFDAISIKPFDTRRHFDFTGERLDSGGRLTAIATPRMLIMFAFNLVQSQIEGLPGWANEKFYPIQAVAPPGAPDLPQQQNAEMERPMVRAMLQHYFDMRFHHATRPMHVLDLVVANDGPKLKKATGDEVAALKAADANSALGPWRMRGGEFFSTAGQMLDLAAGLSLDLQKFVLDKTGLTGHYDFTLTWTPGPGERLRGSPRSSGPSIYSALQHQLGLRLRPAKEPVTVIAIDHIAPPTHAN